MTEVELKKVIATISRLHNEHVFQLNIQSTQKDKYLYYSIIFTLRIAKNTGQMLYIFF